MQLDEKAYSFIQTAKQNGWDKNEVMAYLNEKGYDMGVAPAQPVANQPDPYSALDKAKYMGRAAAEGATLGLGDQVAGYTNAVASDVADMTSGNDWKTRAKGYGKYLLHTIMPTTAFQSGDFKQGRDEFVREQNAFAQAHPGMNLTGELAGGVLTGALGAGKQLAKTAAQQGLKEMAKEGAREGARFGLAYGAGSGLTQDEGQLNVGKALVGGAEGLAGGAVLGAALPVAVAGAAKGVRALGKGFTGLGKAINADFTGAPIQEAVTQKAPRVFVDEWGEVRTPKALQRLLDIDENAVQQAAKEGVPLIDLADQKMLGTASGVRLASPEAEQIFTTYGRERLAGQHPRIVNALKQYFGNKGSHQLLDELNADIQKGAKVLYDKAVYQLDNAGNVLLDNAGRPVGKVLPELEKLNKYELDYVGKVYGTRGLEYEVGGLPQNDMRVLNYAKQLMDDDIQRLTNQGHNNQARILSEKRAAFIEKIDKANPEYKAARNFFERGKRAEEALQAGKKALRGERSNLEYDFGNLTPEEQAFYRKGVGNALEEMSNMQASGGNPAHKVFGEETLRRLKQLGIKDMDQLEKFARAESKASSNIQRLLQGSPTAEREMQAAREVGTDLNVGGALTSPKRTFKRSVAKTINKFVKRLIRDTSEQDRVEIARLLTDPKYLADQVNEMNRLRNAGRANLESIRAGQGANSIRQAMQEKPSQGSIADTLANKLKEEGGFAVNPLAEQGQSVKKVLNSLGEPAEKLLKPRNLVAENFVSDVNNVLKDSSVNNFQKIEMGQIPWVYIANGLEEQPLRTNKLAIRKAMGLLTPEELKAHPEWHNHNVPKDVIDKMPELIADPLAIFKSNTEKGKYVAVLDAKVKGDPVVAIISPGEKGGYTFMPTSYERKSFDEFVKNTQKANNVVYVDTKRSSTPHTLIQAVSVGNDDPTYSIATKEGIVKGYFDNLKRFSNKSQIVDENGKPLVMYHNTTAEPFDTFDVNKIGSSGSGAYHGAGFNFASQPHYVYGKNEMPVYLNAKNVLSSDKKTITRSQLKKMFLEADKGRKDTLVGDFSYQYAPYGSAEYNNSIDKAVDNLISNAESDLDIYSNFTMGSSLTHKETMNLFKKLGFDGAVEKRNGKVSVAVVFDPKQIKSVYNKGTFSKKTPNIYKSLIGGLGISQILRNKENR